MTNRGNAGAFQLDRPTERGALHWTVGAKVIGSLFVAVMRFLSNHGLIVTRASHNPAGDHEPGGVSSREAVRDDREPLQPLAAVPYRDQGGWRSGRLPTN
jgi:hypothetical protein